MCLLSLLTLELSIHLRNRCACCGCASRIHIRSRRHSRRRCLGFRCGLGLRRRLSRNRNRSRLGRGRSRRLGRGRSRRRRRGDRSHLPCRDSIPSWDKNHLLVRKFRGDGRAPSLFLRPVHCISCSALLDRFILGTRSGSGRRSSRLHFSLKGEHNRVLFNGTRIHRNHLLCAARLLHCLHLGSRARAGDALRKGEVARLAARHTIAVGRLHLGQIVQFSPEIGDTRSSRRLRSRVSSRFSLLFEFRLNLLLANETVDTLRIRCKRNADKLITSHGRHEFLLRSAVVANQSLDALTENHGVLERLSIRCKKGCAELISDRREERLGLIVGRGGSLLESLLRRRIEDLGENGLDCRRGLAGRQAFRPHFASSVAHLACPLREQCKHSANGESREFSPFKIHEGVFLENGAERVDGLGRGNGAGFHGERHGVDVAAEQIHQNRNLLRKIDKGGTAEANDLGVAGGGQESVEEVAALVVRLVRTTGIVRLLTQCRSPVARSDRLERDRASLVRRESC